MDIGSITFGPIKTMEEMQSVAARQSALQMQASSLLADLSLRPCNCIGPQAGERQCPCALRVEMAQADQMLREGVTIAGRKYRLVPETEE